MLPGTRFYYDRHGRYRGKASDYGPIAQGIWSLIGLVACGFFVFSWLSEAWWFIALIVTGGCMAFATLSIPILLWQKRPVGWMIALLAVSTVATVILVVVELVPKTAEQERINAAYERQKASEISEPNSETQPAQVGPPVTDSAPAVPPSESQGPTEQVSPSQPESPSDQLPVTSAPRPLTGRNESETASSTSLPTFNCRTTAQPIEQFICSDRSLLGLDARLGFLYRRALDFAEYPGLVRRSQRDWIYHRRNQCRSRTCLIDAYAERSAELSEVAGR